MYLITGRLLATSAGVYIGLFFMGEGWKELQSAYWLFFAIASFSVLAVVVSWFEMKLGAWLLAVAGVALGIDAYFFAGSNRLLIGLLLALPLTLSAALLYMHLMKLPAVSQKKIRK